MSKTPFVITLVVTILHGYHNVVFMWTDLQVCTANAMNMLRSV